MSIYIVNPSIVSSLSRDGLKTLSACCKALDAIATARLLALTEAGDAGDTASDNSADRLLPIDEACAMLSVTKSFLYHHGERLGLVRKLGDGTLRYPLSALQRFIAEGHAPTPARRWTK